MKLRMIREAFQGLILLCSLSVYAQEEIPPSAREMFQRKGEVYFSFQVNNHTDIELLTKIISIDQLREDTVFAYANQKEFSAFLAWNLPYEILPHPGDLLDESQTGMMAHTPDKVILWNFYPTYDQYLDFMEGFETSYPEICKLIYIGYSVEGRKLLAVKISDTVNKEEAESQVLYTSSMHGDETTGYVTMLHLIDYLLSNYGTDPRITNIINTTEIFINPLANPDGTYWNGNNTVIGAIRYNANYVDLNRNYPDPEDGPHPDGNPWQAETLAFMAFADSNHFVMGANFHGGAEVFNYPWDTWAKLAADDLWWQFTGREYVDTVHIYSPSTYFSGFNNGITNGYAWYTISGGRQDYMNYWHSCREVTLEISKDKLLSANQLINHWGYNYRSLLNYIEQANYGLQGIVTDSVTGESLYARIFIPGHDIDSSQVYTKLPSGYYSRLLYEGSYTLLVTAPGYFPKTIADVPVVNWETTPLNIQLVPLNIGIREKWNQSISGIYPNPSDGHINLILPDHITCGATLECYDTQGRKVWTTCINETPRYKSCSFDLGNLPDGLYFLRILAGDQCYSGRIIIR